MRLAFQPNVYERHRHRRPRAHHAHLVAHLRRAVPRAVLGNEQRPVVRPRKLAGGIERHTQRRRVRLDLVHRRHVVRRVVPRPELRIDDVRAVYVRVAVVRPRLGDDVHLVRRQIVTQPVAAVVREP